MQFSMDATRFVRRFFLASNVGFALLLSGTVFSNVASASCATESSDAGCVHFEMNAKPPFDLYTKAPTDDQIQWLQTHFWRMRDDSPYFDSRLAWYSRVWDYQDIYGLRTTDPMAIQHPEWILKDKSGNNLFLHFDCANGTCTQYAADTSNSAYREWWIGKALDVAARGYKGIWIDDVNLSLEVSDGYGKLVTPMDPNTGSLMTLTAWKTYMVEFLELVRDRMPNSEILHNSIWYAGSGTAGTDPLVQREILAADYINREHGFSDSGLAGGTGTTSMTALLNFFDVVHSLNRHFSIQEYFYNGDYPVACYFLVSSGMDSFANDDATPDNWTALYDVKLGAPLGVRYGWQGVIRRDFANGVVLVNLPDSPTATVTPAGSFKDSTGKSVTTLTLAESQGAVLLGVPYFPPAPVALQINTGGHNTGAFIADTDVVGGSLSTSANNVDLSGVSNPAPMTVYQSRRVGVTGQSGFTYTIPNLRTDYSFDVRLHFSDPWAWKPGMRIFSVVINGTTVLSNFDLMANGGASNKAVIKKYTFKPNSKGQIVIQFKNGTTQGTAMVNGIEILPVAQ